MVVNSNLRSQCNIVANRQTAREPDLGRQQAMPANPDIVADAFRGYGGTILRTTLSRDQQSKVEDVLHNRAA